jgi:hypothetical protein
LGRTSREKGKRGEREVAKAITAMLGVEASRLVRQHNGDADIIGVPGWTIEVKRYANASETTMRSWWTQAIAQTPPGEIPCVWYRLDRRPWRVLWPLEAAMTGWSMGWGWEYVVDSTPDAWAAVVRECNHDGWL